MTDKQILIKCIAKANNKCKYDCDKGYCEFYGFGKDCKTMFLADYIIQNGFFRLYDRNEELEYVELNDYRKSDTK